MTEHQNILQNGMPSRTAMYVARHRALHQLLDDPIVFDDPLALAMLASDERSDIEENPFQYNDPISRGERGSSIVRSRFMEDQVLGLVADGVQQYVILGAGLDTFAYRRQHVAGLRVFEVDHEATQQWKRQRLIEAGIECRDNLTFVASNFEKGRLADELVEAGFREDEPACFSWLGVTMYLSEPSIIGVLKYVARRPPGTTIVFDYQVRDVPLNPVQKAFLDVMEQRVASLGEPWITSFNSSALREMVEGFGFSDVSIADSEELMKRYLYRRKDGLRCGGQIMRARV